jgi:hypothetical protein
MQWRPERSALLLTGAIGTMAFWVVSTIAGLHPDGAILGFSGTFWMIWATTERDDRRRQRRREEKDESDSDP